MVAGLYRKRWKIETLFQVLESTLESEQTRLGYPKAGLFAFCVSLVAYNVLAVVRAALRTVHGREVVEEKVSTYYLIGRDQGRVSGHDDCDSRQRSGSNSANMTIAELAGC